MIWIIVSIVFLIVAVLLYQLSNIDIRQTKDYAEMYVEEGDIIDCQVMITPPEKYSQLLQIDYEMRNEVSEYMRKNNFKLKSGKQEFVRNNPTFEELVENGFVFEEIE